MNNTNNILVKEMGKLSIYITQSEKAAESSLLKKIKAKPLYREIIRAAKEDKIMAASAFNTHYGYSNHEKVQSKFAEGLDRHLALCIELIDSKSKLEAFCKSHVRLLAGKSIVFKPVEYWEIV